MQEGIRAAASWQALAFFFTIAILTGGGGPRCGFDLHFLMTNDTENLFLCVLALCISLLEKCLFKKFFAVL
jgi:hypothetical protein